MVIHLAKVRYGTPEERRVWLDEIVDALSQIVEGTEIDDDNLHQIPFVALSAIVTEALVSKHIGFSEEREWRLIYNKYNDEDEEVASDLGYAIGRRGPEPKFKFRVWKLNGIPLESLTLASLLERVILGPGVGTALLVRGFQRMLAATEVAHLQSRVFGSSIPFRPA